MKLLTKNNLGSKVHKKVPKEFKKIRKKLGGTFDQR